MTQSITTSSILKLIADRHNVSNRQDATAVFFEFRNGTGAVRQERYLDAFAMELWPSKQFHRQAYEVKVSRADWLRELDKPEKRAWGMEISNEFWFVAPSGVIKPEEVPTGCGLLQVMTGKGGAKLRRAVPAPQREPRAFTEGEIAAIARRSMDNPWLQGLRWRHAGEEINAQTLEAIIAEKFDWAITQRIKAESKKTAAEHMAKVMDALKVCAKALTDAGCRPPDFMVDPARLCSVHRMPFTEAEARQWVEQNVATGHGGWALLSSGRQMRGMANAMAREATRLTRLAEQVEEKGYEAQRHEKESTGEAANG